MAKSGLNISGIADLQKALRNLGETGSASLFSVLNKSAQEVQRRAKAYVPVDEGNLEDAIKLERRDDQTSGRRMLVIGVDMATPAGLSKTVGDYAIFIHEGVYKLGPKSVEKANRTGVQVGPKFLERAMQEMERPTKDAFDQEVRRLVAKANSRVPKGRNR
jgi:hypothetical protein